MTVKTVKLVWSEQTINTTTYSAGESTGVEFEIIPTPFPIKVRGGEARRIIKLPPKEIVDGQIIFEADHPYIYVGGIKKKILLEGDV